MIVIFLNTFLGNKKFDFSKYYKDKKSLFI